MPQLRDLSGDLVAAPHHPMISSVQASHPLCAHPDRAETMSDAPPRTTVR
jgi:hypothetical protein